MRYIFENLLYSFIFQFLIGIKLDRNQTGRCEYVFVSVIGFYDSIFHEDRIQISMAILIGCDQLCNGTLLNVIRSELDNQNNR